MKVIRWDSPYGSILRPTGAEGGRLGPSIISGGDGAPPLTGEGPYESPVIIKPSVYSRQTPQRGPESSRDLSKRANK